GFDAVGVVQRAGVETGQSGAEGADVGRGKRVVAHLLQLVAELAARPEPPGEGLLQRAPGSHAPSPPAPREDRFVQCWTFFLPRPPAELTMTRSGPTISRMSTARSGVHLVVG